jgi:hypothetical protein
MLVGGPPSGSPPPAEQAILSLGWMRQALVALPESHETEVEIDKAEVMQRMGMVAMSAAAILHHGPRPDLLSSIQRDASIAMQAAIDARDHATWETGQHVARSLMMAAAMMLPLPATLAIAPKSAD